MLTDLLKRVSRSFYLTLRVLPADVRRPVGLAYLLARTTDTVADTALVPAADRLATLDTFRRGILHGGVQLDLSQFLTPPASSPRPTTTPQASDAERALLTRATETLQALNELPQADRQMVNKVLEIIISGQALDLERFAQASVESLVALRSETELDDYTYRVAGCVGEFWTETCRAHLFPEATFDMECLLRRAVRFGKGLQLVNILRDVPEDLRHGRCYLPADRLAEHGLEPSRLLDPAAMAALTPLYREFLARAEGLLADGWTYANMLPRNQARVRLACAWPILIGVRTLARLRASNVLDPSRRVKLSRSEVRRLLAASVWCYPRRRAWERLFDRARQ